MTTKKSPAQIRSERVRRRIREALDVIRLEIEAAPTRVYPGKRRLTVAEITRRAGASRNTVRDMDEVHELLTWYRAIHAREESRGKRAKPDYLQALDRSERMLRLQDADRLALQAEIERYKQELVRLKELLAEREAFIEVLRGRVDPHVLPLNDGSPKGYWDD